MRTLQKLPDGGYRLPADPARFQPCKTKETAMNAIKDTKLSLASLNHIIICGRCGALFLALGWSNDTHNAWHAEHDGAA